MYPACIEVYDVDLHDTLVTRHKRLRMFFLAFATVTPMHFALNWLWPLHGEAREVWDMAIQAILYGLLMSAICSSRKWMLYITKSWSKYQIVVADDEIKTRNFESHNRMLSRTIQRGEIRTLIEKEAGLLISSRDRVGTFFFGGIWIPKRLADYEYLRRLLSRWTVKESV
jgi:hypothetical protein